MHKKQTAEEMKRTTVSFEDDQYKILEKWAEKAVRTIPNLIQAIIVGVLRGETPTKPVLPNDQPKGE
jgi:predicted DNA-binding ribbon-helix-helix protein